MPPARLTLAVLCAGSLAAACSVAEPSRDAPATGTSALLDARDPQCEPMLLEQAADTPSTTPLVFPGVLAREALLQGNPLATYAALRELESEYLASEIFRDVYRQVRLNSEQFLGFPCAGVQGMRVQGVRGVTDSAQTGSLEAFVPAPALDVIRERAAATRIVIWGEEHHLPQTRSLYEAMLRALWEQGYRYLGAEAFEDTDMSRFQGPDYRSGYYLRDPIFASAVRTAQELGYVLVSYDTRERGPDGDDSFRDRTQAHNLVERVFARDSAAKLLILAGRLHASEIAGPDGWTPMAHVLKRLTGIDPFTVYAPTMTERLTPAEEDPLYRHATAGGWVVEPVIFQHREDRRPLGSEAFDAYVFFPRTRLIGGRPDWMIRMLGRNPVPVPEPLLRGEGMRLIQAFRSGSPATSIPQDQVVPDAEGTSPVLMLPPGSYWVRSIDVAGRILGEQTVEVQVDG
jgi:hypothetical protein